MAEAAKKAVGEKKTKAVIKSSTGGQYNLGYHLKIGGRVLNIVATVEIGLK